ncbi:hypothetical protein [Kribbella sp. DT2]|uniref:hypothetical protein n=1 Tax=Kribbella sp. DT2 TaxID=3393427 RepID=UPI003CE7E0A5
METMTMKTGHGLRRYFYEYVAYEAIRLARERTGRIIPISQAKAVRRRTDDRLAEQGRSVADPNLGVQDLLTALEASIRETVPGCEPIFADHSVMDPLLQSLQAQFMRQVGLGDSAKATPALPISPYDPQWSQRATVKSAGTTMVYLPDETIEQDMGGETSRAASPKHGQATLWIADGDGKLSEAGPAMTDEDACGLTALRDLMSVREYQQVRQWVLDGGRDPRTGRVDRDRFMSPLAVERSVAILRELQDQGLGYEVRRDQNPGQIKARVSGTGMEIRLTEPRAREDYAGARIYDNGLVVRYSTNHKLERGKTAVHSPTPDEAVDLLRFAQGRAVPRRDRPELLAGQIGSTHLETARRGRRGSAESTEVEDSYHVGKESMFVVKDYRAPGQHQREGSKVMLRREAADRSLPEFFVNAEVAEQYLSQAVESARVNLRIALDAEGLITAFEQQRADGLNLVEFEPPEHSSDPEVAAVQRAYWDVLTGHRTELLRPGATAEMYEERLGMIGEFQAAGPGIQPDFGNLVYGGTAEEKVRAHAEEILDELVGNLEPEPRLVDDDLVEQRFDPVRVAKYMTSPKGQWSNLDELAQALRRLHAGPSEMLGSGFQTDRFKDRLVRFDQTTAVPVDTHGSAFLRRIGQTVHSSLARNATEPGEVLIDEQGVIRWTAEKMRRDSSTTAVAGEIGQVFEPGEYGEILTRFASGDNGLIVPGYEARIAPQVPGETKSVEERTLLRGYEQAMTERIEYQIAGDLLSGRSEVGEGASLNRVYSQLYGTKHPVDFIDRARGEKSGELDPWATAILATEARRVRYSNEIKAGSTVYAEHQAGKGESDPADDNHFDAWKLTGGRNMAVLTGSDQNGLTAPGGYFDPVMTGGATNQGIARYLTEDAQVRPDGRIVPGDPATATGARAPLMNRPELETLRYDPFDRQQMTASTLMQSSKITAATGTAMMTFGGWTADDPIVISREFAQTNQIRGAGGNLRDLVVGDKLSDLHGNKGVVSLIVDRGITTQAAERENLGREAAWFRANPDLHVVLSPFSLISRRNAGSGRELISGGASDLVAPDGSAQAGGLGRMRFIVTHMAVDEKTKVYDDGAVLSGKGRKASSQLAWALGAQDCPAIMQEFYGSNAGAETNLREYMLSVGIAMDADGTLHVVGLGEEDRGRSQDTGDELPVRRLFAMPELTRTSNGGLHTLAMRRAFGALIGDKGGDLEIPFPLSYPTSEQTEAVSETSWKLPVLSSHLRSGQEFDDGSVITHDYTNRYLDIHEQACRYRWLQEKLETGGSLSQGKREELVDGMNEAAARAQRSFEAINSDLEQRIFSGKHNIFKTGLMSSRLADSATAVWTADPRLDIDQIALSPVMADQLGLAEGDHALVWRDPVLRDAGVRYLRVAVDQRLTGVAINPVMDQCFDGDFDGDAVAVVKLHSQAARIEAMAKLSVPANLLDTGALSHRGTHPFAMQISLDTQVALSKSPELRQELDRLSGATNLIKQGAGHEDAETTRARQDDVTRQLSGFYRSAQRNEFGTALSFADLQSHLNSVRDVCVTTGAKGNVQKLTDYARYLGGRSGRSGITQADQEASMFATAIKTHGTGLGGSYSQRAVRALRNADLKAVLEVTYPVTQSILQAKHDAGEARHKYEMLQGPGRDLWRGRLLEHLGPGKWRTVFEDGAPVQATKEQWADQFVDFYTARDGFGVLVNPEYVDRVAEALTDPRTGLVRNLEDDPSLQGSLMDRMAYGGTLGDLIIAAAKRENLFDGEKNEQFCCAATRRSRRTPTAQPEDLGHSTGPRAQTIAPALVWRDVVPDEHVATQARGSQRGSAHAVAMTTRQRPARIPPRSSVPSIDIDPPATADGSDYEMGS